MTTSAVVISSKYDLLSLHRGLMEARFCDQANDPDVSGSPILAKIHRDIISAIIEADLSDGLSPERWKAWLKITEDRREWSVALKRASVSSLWRGFSYSDKATLTLDLLAPFDVDPEAVEFFIDAVEKLRKETSSVLDSPET